VAYREPLGHVFLQSCFAGPREERASVKFW
jgi:hypothetical protein